MKFTREQSQAFLLGAIISAIPGIIFALTFAVRYAGDLGDFLRTNVSGWVAAPIVAIAMAFLFVLLSASISGLGGILFVSIVRLVRVFHPE